MRHLTLIILAILVSVAVAETSIPDPDLDPQVFVDTTVPGLTKQVEKLRDAVFGVQDKLVGIANAQGISVPIPQINMIGSDLILLPITEGPRLVKEFTEVVTDANLKLLEAQVDVVIWSVNTTFQLHNTLVSHLRDANDMLADINNQLLKSATAPLRALQSQMEDSIETLQDFMEDVTGVGAVADAVDDLFDSFGW